ncbi:AFG1-like ATPase [Lamellibrachia satsuma]|nr:AFG1-like ATPase [Lamellibrachia satsuma]
MAVTLTARLWPGVGGGAVLNRFWLGCPRAIRQASFDHPLDGISSKKPVCGPVCVYEARVETGELKNDDYQKSVIKKLECLHNELKEYQPTPVVTSWNIFSKLFASSSKKIEDASTKLCPTAPNGLYLYGSVGCGKTMLMDLFYSTCTLKRKRRVHFHSFMLDIHRRIHLVKQNMPKRDNSVSQMQSYDPIQPVAEEISAETSLLCFDEFQVTDIADAMILKRLFSHLWRGGTVVVATSNRPPKDLYKHGLQRVNFLPFIPMLKANCGTVNLDSGIDYRRQTIPAEGKVYFVSSECDAKYELDRIYEDLVSKEKAEEGPYTLTVLGRKVHLSKTCGSIIDCTFDELCMKPLGAVDYLTIASTFDTLILRDIPNLTLERKTEGRRFTTLIDTVYDTKMQLVCSAETKADELFLSGKLSESDMLQARVLMGDLDIDVGSEKCSSKYLHRGRRDVCV